MVVKIKDLPIEERPYEKLINFGVDSLTNEELLSILIKSGTSKYSAKELASIILKNLNTFFSTLLFVEISTAFYIWNIFICFYTGFSGNAQSAKKQEAGNVRVPCLRIFPARGIRLPRFRWNPWR